MSTNATTKNIEAMQSIMDRLDIHSTATSQCCPFCLTRLEHRISTRDYYCCPSCGEQSHAYDLVHKPLPEFSPMEDEGIAHSITYYHWTTKENWLENLPSALMVHLGCKQAAYERMRDERLNKRWASENPEGVVYSVTINPSVPFEGIICMDEENPEVGCAEDAYSEFSNGYVERYVNIIEAPGSISLCASKDDFTVTGQISAREFFGDKAMELN